MIGVCWALSDSSYSERGQRHLLVPLPAQKILLLQQHPTGTHSQHCPSFDTDTT